MARIQFENGMVVNFNGNPTPADIEEVAASLGLRGAPKQSFSIPESASARSSRVDTAKSEAALSQKEADKYRGASFVGQVGKEAVRTVLPSAFNLGETIGKTLGVGSKTTQALTEAEKNAGTVQVNLLKKIREYEAAGKDATKWKQLYNQSVQEQGKISELATEATTGLPSNTKALAQVGGVGVDVLGAGTFGKATAGMKAGQFASKTPTAVQAVKTVAQQPQGLFTKTGIGRVAAGGALGYGYDVTQGLQGTRGEDREGVSALIPGVGTALGAGIPALTGLVKSAQNIATKGGRLNATVQKRTSTLSTLEQNNAVVRRQFEAARRKGVDPIRVLSETDLLNDAVDKNGTINTRNAQDNLKEIMRPLDGEVRKRLKEEGKTISLATLRKAMVRGLQQSDIQGGARVELQNQIAKEIKGLQMTAINGQIPLENIHDAKIFKMSNQNYLNPEANEVGKSVGTILKEIVEQNTDSMDVATYNNELSKLYALRDVIKAMNGKKVMGGRAAKYFKTILGGMVGAQFGPLSTVVGAEIGNAIGGAQLQSSLGGNINQPLQASQRMLDAMKLVK